VLMRFVGALDDAIFRLAAAWKLFDPFVDTTGYMCHNRCCRQPAPDVAITLVGEITDKFPATLSARLRCAASRFWCSGSVIANCRIAALIACS
jgi:hypothetical protein